MATWKKVIVSGSQAEFAGASGSFSGSFSGNGANLTGVTATAVFPTVQTTPILSTTKIFSNDGSNTYVFAGQITGSTYAGVSGDITIGTGGVAAIGSSKVTSAMIVDATIVGGDIASATVANSNLVNSSITIGSTSTALGASNTTLAGLTSVTSTGFTGSLQGTASYANQALSSSYALNSTTAATASYVLQAVSASFATSASNAATVITNANLTGNVTSVGNTTTIASGVVTSAMITDDTIVNADINTAAGIVYTKLNLASSTIHSGSFFNGITVVSGSSQISYTGLSNTPAGIVSASVLAAGSGQGSTTLATNGVSSGDVTATGLGTAGTPTFAGLTITNGNIAINNTTSTALTTTGTTAAVFNTTATTVNAFGAATTLNLGNASGTTTVAGNAIVQGDFTVNGTVTYLNVQDLYVEDRFIVVASGSATAGDGGLIIDRGSDAAGNIAYGFDSTTDRWGFQSGLADTTNTFDPTSASGVSGSFAVYSFTEAAHGATKPSTGEFAVVGSQYLDNAGNFWIYTA